MRRFIPSPAMVVAFAALLVALSGTAVAASLISGSRLKNRSVSSKKIKVNSLTSKEVAETKLGTVPRAKLARNSLTVGSVGAKRIYSLQSVGQNDTPILNAQGLVLYGACPGGNPRVRARSAVNDADLRVSVVGNGKTPAVAAGTGNFDVGTVANVISNKLRGTSTIVYTRPDNHVLTVTLGFSNAPTLGGKQLCSFGGSAFGH